MAIKSFKSNKKAVISTILVIQLIFMTLLAMTALRTERANFVFENEFSRIAAYKLRMAHEDIHGDIYYLKTSGAGDETISEYTNMVGLNTDSLFLLEIDVNNSYLILKDKLLDMEKEGEI